MKKTILLLSWLLLAVGVYAQGNKFTSEENFIADVKSLYEKTTNQNAPLVAADLEAAWKNMAADQKHRIFEMTHDMVKKGLRPSPHLELFFNCITAGIKAKQMPAEQLNEFLKITELTLKDYNYRQDIAQNYFLQVRNFLAENYLYKSPTNSNYLSASKGTKFSFGYGKHSGSKPAEVIPVVNEEAPKEEKAPVSDEDSWNSAPTEVQGGEVNWNDDNWGNDIKPEVTEKKANKVARPTQGRLTFPKPDLSPLEGPFIKLEKTDLTIGSRQDTTDIKGTEGTLLLVKNTFVGMGGRVDWTNVKLPAADVYCELSEYEFNIRVPYLRAEFAKMNYKGRIDTPVEGVYEYKNSNNNNKPHADYPRFKSYYNDITVKGLAKEMIYVGGFSVIGKRFSSNNFSNGASTVFISRNNVRKFKAASRKEYIFSDTVVSNPQAEVVVYMGEKDSISHPGAKLRYDYKTGDLTARKDKHEYNYTPFFDSYHNVEITADNLKWNVQQDSMVFSVMTGNTAIQDTANTIRAVVESVDYFDQNRLYQLQGLNNYHPLLASVAYAKSQRTTSFYSDDMAQALKLNPNSLKDALRALDRAGYLSFDNTLGWVELKRKGLLYANAHQKLVDYDKVFVESLMPHGRNIVLDLKTNDLIVNGVIPFPLRTPDINDPKDKLNIFVKPSNAQVKIGKNRDITFDGTMSTSNFANFKGKEFLFKYDSFKVNMKTIDEIEFIVKDSTGQSKPMSNKIKSSSGTFYIANPKNKANRPLQPNSAAARDTTHYPVFDATKGGYIGFGGKEILGGEQVYSDSLIKFDLEAFKIDNVGDRKPEDTQLKGMFKTTGIFPDFEETVTIMPDNSFGFDHNTDKNKDKYPKGYPLYNSSAKFEGHIVLNNDGIRSYGEITYLTAKLKSNDFIYYPDSVTTLSKHHIPEARSEGIISAGELNKVTYPDVNMDNYLMRWKVKRDSMLLSNTSTPFEIYGKSTNPDQISTFAGTLSLSPKQLSGNGIIENKGARAKSQEFVFQQSKYNAHHAEFEIKTEGDNAPALRATNVKIDYDLTDRLAVIETEVAGEESFSFPYTKYKTSLGRANWNFDAKKVTMSMLEGSDVSDTKFTSTHPAQEGLSFIGSDAVYELNDYRLNVGGVPFIFSVDSKIFPDSQKVTIRRDAEMDVLNNSELLVNAETEFHRLFKGHIKIHSRSRFEGDAVYYYINDAKDMFEIKFESFKKQPRSKEDNRVITYATSRIKEEASFIKQSGVQFRGEVLMRADSSNLIFSGDVRFTDDPDNPWVPIDPNSKELKVAGIEEGANGAKLGSGLFLSREGKDLYVAFRTPLKNAKDRMIFETSGILTQDPVTKKYNVEAADRKETHRGNKYVYSKQTGDVQFEGKLDLIEKEPNFEMKISGIGRGKFTENKYTINSMMVLNTEVKGSSFKIMADDIEKTKEDLPTTIRNNDSLYYKLAAHISADDIEKYLDRVKREKAAISDVLPSPLVLSNVVLHWSDTYKSFYSSGKIGLSNVMKTDLNIAVDGFVEIPIASNDQSINIYIELSPKHWYFFTYRNKDLKMLSSHEEFNAEVGNPKSKDKFKLADVTEKAGFISRFRRAYLGQNAPDEQPEDSDTETIEEKNNDDGN